MNRAQDVQLTKLGHPIGTWSITTEGDCEGKSITTLASGVRGHIGDLALAYADKCYYSLRFERCKPPKRHDTAKSVNVSLDIDSGTWDMNPPERSQLLRAWLGNDWVVEPGQYFASVTLSRTKPQATTETTYPFKTQTITLQGANLCKRAVEKLIEHSAWYVCTPYPDDAFKITVKEDFDLRTITGETSHGRRST